MKPEELHSYYQRFKFGEDNFHRLMKRRVQHVLLVSSIYDAYILEQDGRLSEQIIGEYRQLNLSLAPRISTVPLGGRVMDKLEAGGIDMVIIMMRMGEESCFALGEEIRQRQPHMPLLLLANRLSYKRLHPQLPLRRAPFDDIFLWNGDATLFLAMIKSVEDRWNAADDTRDGLVQVILLVESSVEHYSMFLPLLYTQIMKQTQALITSELIDTNKRLRMRARPKVLLTHHAEEARALFERYSQSVIGVLTNVHIQGEGEAGLQLLQHMRTARPDLPVLVQSCDIAYREAAQALNAGFVHKQSPHLLHAIRAFLAANLGFGEFVFRLPDGTEIARADTLHEFARELAALPGPSLRYHGARNDFSTWLIARGEVQIAREVRKLHNEDFVSVDDQRNFLVRTIEEVQHRQNRGKIVSFDVLSLQDDDKIVRLGEGSLGGKGRGLAFLNALLATMDFAALFPDVHVRLPRTAIVGTAEFDWFIEHNDLRALVQGQPDDTVKRLFLQGELSPGLRGHLNLYVQAISWPLAVRSSGLLEDSQSQPFAGIYATYMLPNNHPDIATRQEQLEQAIKLVFASPFLQDARSYIEGVHYALEEEKMAVVVQEIAGTRQDDGLFYPLFSGVAQSYNYYPLYTRHEEGIASLAAGLGKAVVDGERAFRFCPAHPRVDLIAPEEQVKHAQREFYGLDLRQTELHLQNGEDATLRRERISEKHRIGPLRPLTSVWDWQNLRFVDSEYAQGARALTFRNVVRFGRFPLPELLSTVLEFGQVAHGVPVEIEFAVTLEEGARKGVFHLLQIRPLTVMQEAMALELSELPEDDLALVSTQSLGNGVIDDIRDIVWLDPDCFDNTQTVKMAMELEEINRGLREEGRLYILLGPGRWGSSDRFLGVPVKWQQIDCARVIVEVGIPGFPVDASQGSHFFHNLVAMNIGYFTVPNERAPNRVDWTWLRAQPRKRERGCFVHTRLPAPVRVQMDGRRGAAVVFKPLESRA